MIFLSVSNCGSCMRTCIYGITLLHDQFRRESRSGVQSLVVEGYSLLSVRFNNVKGPFLSKRCLYYISILFLDKILSNFQISFFAFKCRNATRSRYFAPSLVSKVGNISVSCFSSRKKGISGKNDTNGPK